MQDDLKVKDINLLVDIMADLAFESGDSHAVVFKDWLQRANIPRNWIQSFGQGPADTRAAARKLITSFYNRGINKDDPDFNTLGSILQVLLSDEVGLDKASIIAAVMVRYRLIQDDQLLNQLIVNYQVPLLLKAISDPKC